MIQCRKNKFIISICQESIQLQLWDTAGTERYNSMGQNFYRNSEACVLVFDLTVKDSFTNIDNWRKEFLTSLGPKDPESFPFVLVGNKSDMKDDKVHYYSYLH